MCPPRLRIRQRGLRKFFKLPEAFLQLSLSLSLSLSPPAALYKSRDKRGDALNPTALCSLYRFRPLLISILSFARLMAALTSTPSAARIRMAAMSPAPTGASFSSERSGGNSSASI